MRILCLTIMTIISTVNVLSVEIFTQEDTCKIFSEISKWINDSVNSSVFEKKISISPMKKIKCKQILKEYRVRKRKITYPYIIFYYPKIEDDYIYVSVDLYYHRNARLKMYFKLIKIQDDFEIINCKRWVQF